MKLLEQIFGGHMAENEDANLVLEREANLKSAWEAAQARSLTMSILSKEVSREYDRLLAEFEPTLECLEHLAKLWAMREVAQTLVHTMRARAKSAQSDLSKHQSWMASPVGQKRLDREV